MMGAPPIKVALGEFNGHQRTGVFVHSPDVVWAINAGEDGRARRSARFTPAALALADPRVSACTPAAGIQCHVCRRELHARFVTWVTAAKGYTIIFTVDMHSRDGASEGQSTQ